MRISGRLTLRIFVWNWTLGSYLFRALISQICWLPAIRRNSGILTVMIEFCWRIFHLKCWKSTVAKRKKFLLIRILSPKIYIRILPSAFFHPHFIIRVLSSASGHPRFVIRFLSSAFIIRNLSSVFYHSRYITRVLSSSFYHRYFSAI